MEDNKLIMRFMDVNPVFVRPDFYRWSDSPKYYVDGTLDKVLESMSDYLAYGDDYNLLMPVIERIEELGYIVDICGKAVSIHTDGAAELIVDNCGLDYERKIDSIYSAVVQFCNYLHNK